MFANNPAAATGAPTPDSTIITCMRKLPLHNEPSSIQLVLHTTWHPTTPSDASSSSSTAAAIELLLVNCATGVTYRGNVTHATLATTAERLEIDTATFHAATRHMLTGDPIDLPPDELQIQNQYDELESAAAAHLFELTPSPTSAPTNSDTVTLTWRIRKSAQLTVIYGTALLQRQSTAAPLGVLLLEAVGQLADRSAQMRSRRIKSDVMLFNHRLLRGNFDECVHSKLELEQGMLRRFLGVLNEKKQRIRELERDIGGFDAPVADEWQPQRSDEAPRHAAPAADEQTLSDASDTESVFSDTLSGPLTAAAAKVVAAAMAAKKASEALALEAAMTTASMNEPVATNSSQMTDSSMDSMPQAPLLPKRMRTHVPDEVAMPQLPAPEFDAAARLADDQAGAAKVADGTTSSAAAYGCDTQAMIDDMD